MTGAEMIVAERKRQIEECDEDPVSKHTDESLAMAACHYAIPEACYPEILNLWPESWNDVCDRRGETTRIRDLIIAGALIAAEIDRILANRYSKLET